LGITQYNEYQKIWYYLRNLHDSYEHLSYLN